MDDFEGHEPRRLRHETGIQDEDTLAAHREGDEPWLCAGCGHDLREWTRATRHSPPEPRYDDEDFAVGREYCCRRCRELRGAW